MCPNLCSKQGHKAWLFETLQRSCVCGEIHDTPDFHFWKGNGKGLEIFVNPEYIQSHRKGTVKQ